MATLSAPQIDAAPAQAIARQRLLVVIYANPDYYPPTYNAVKILGRHFQVTVIARNMDRPCCEWGEIEVIRTGEYASAVDKETASPLTKLTEYWNFCATVRRAVAEREPHVVYAYDAHGFVSALRARRRRSLPVIFHLHELPALKNASAYSLQSWITKLALHQTRAAALVVLPEPNRAKIWLQAAHDTRQAMIVPNCSSLDFFSSSSDLNELARIRFACRRLLCIGWMGESNGQREAVRAVAMVRTNVGLILVGPHASEFENELNDLAQNLGVQSRVSIEQWVPHSELASRFSGCAVGLSLYRPVSQNWEFNSSATNKVFEYSALGLPVVVPDRNSYREFFAGDEWVVYANPEDPASIARAIEFVLADRDRYVAMSLAARRAHEEKYNYEHVFAPALERILAMTQVG
jgi:glycosyltransferase involved in cell wall biosynthesis